MRAVRVIKPAIVGKEVYRDAYLLRQRVKTGDLDEAIHLVLNKHKSLADTPVWSTLIRRAAEAKKGQLALELWTQMRKRGALPEPRTYTALFHAFAENGAALQESSALMSRLAALHKSYLEATAVLDSFSHATDAPTNAYLQLLASVPNPDLAEIQKVYSAMPSQGRRAPTPTTYTILLKAAAKVKDQTAALDFMDDLLNIINSQPLAAPIDTFVVSAFTAALASTKMTDLKTIKRAMSMADQVIQLAVSDPPRLVLDSKSITDLFTWALSIKRRKMLIAWFKLLWPRYKSIPLSAQHFYLFQDACAKGKTDHVTALESLNWQIDIGIPLSQLTPTPRNYSSTMQAILHSRGTSRLPWLLQIYSRGTGIELESLLSLTKPIKVQFNNDIQRIPLKPTHKIIYIICEAALMEPGGLRQVSVQRALRISYYLGYRKYNNTPNDDKNSEDSNYWQLRVRQVHKSMLAYLLSSPQLTQPATSAFTAEECREWIKDIRSVEE